MCDRIALNLLYIQTVCDVEKGWIVASKDVKEQLCNLQARGNKKEYLEIARQLPSYGCIQFPPTIVDYPDPNTIANVVIGNRELCLRTTVGKKIQETKFKVTRLRCWRVTTIHNVRKLYNPLFHYKVLNFSVFILLFFCRMKKFHQILQMIVSQTIALSYLSNI